MSTRFLVLACLLALVSQSNATTRQLWVWVDGQGVTHYSDRPAPGAKLVSITSPSPSADAAAPAPATLPASSTPRRPQQPAAVEYRLLEIFEPESEESFFGVDTVVSVRMRSEPDLAAGDQTRLYVDAKLVEGQPPGLEYSLSGLERGAHSVRAVIVDALGNERIRSEPRVFHIRQPTANPAQNVGPKLRPRPRPSGN
jgi:hypothetical protein